MPPKGANNFWVFLTKKSYVGEKVIKKHCYDDSYDGLATNDTVTVVAISGDSVDVYFRGAIHKVKKSDLEQNLVQS